MQRHFSTRGEALSELTAARHARDQRASRNAAFNPQADRRMKSALWFSHPEQAANVAKTKAKEVKKDVSPVL